MSRYEDLLRLHGAGISNNLYGEMCHLAQQLESELDIALKEGLRLTIELEKAEMRAEARILEERPRQGSEEGEVDYCGGSR